MASTHLLGVFLTILTYRGPSLVYHYYNPALSPAGQDRAVSQEEGISWSSDDESDEASDEEQRLRRPIDRPRSQDERSISIFDSSHTEVRQANDGTSGLPYSFEEDLIAEMLCPPEALCNKRFSLTVESLMFVGIPVHILDTGTWRKLKEKKGAADADRKNAYVTSEDSPMRMFHVCFVCEPPINMAAEAEKRLYDHVLVPLVRALRQEQAARNYVWHEVALMQRIAEAAGPHSTLAGRQANLEQQSELARALREVCGAIARMEIARVMINGKPRAFQVPLQLELAQLPSWYDEVPPHAHLSTSNLPSKEIGHGCYDCYGLLLLGDPEDIVKEIDVDPKGPIAMMIRNIDPTASIAELAKHNRIDIKQIVNLVWSLVYWRRARIIIPLNYRYVYSVSPLLPTKKVHTLAKSFHTLFPVIPPLQRFLSLLSTTKPRPFILHVPSADHRPIYMRALAWLLQNDLVVHLPTFAQVIITRKIKIASMYTDESDENEEVVQAMRGSALDIGNDTVAEQLQRRKWLRRKSSGHNDDLDDIQESVILDPRRATPLENRWLAQVAVSGTTRNPDLAALFQRVVKYFNKQDNLEQVMCREKISREEMRRLLQEFQPYILTYRHW